MTQLLQMTLFGDPVSKARPRSGANGHTYTPERTRAAERAIVAAVQQELAGQVPSDKPVGLRVEFHCATNRRADLDNLVKLVTDAMNGLVYVDDFQIQEISARLFRGVGKAKAMTLVAVYEVLTTR